MLASKGKETGTPQHQPTTAVNLCCLGVLFQKFAQIRKVALVRSSTRTLQEVEFFQALRSRTCLLVALTVVCMLLACGALNSRHQLRRLPDPIVKTVGAGSGKTLGHRNVESHRQIQAVAWAVASQAD